MSFYTDPLSFDNISHLTATREPENARLDYKELLTGSPRDSAELAKDVSAMANSTGGYVIIGVRETKKHYPDHPPCGISTQLKGHKVEDWIEQVLNSNIAQRVVCPIRAVPFPENGDKCLVVIQVPLSNRAPHMVTGPKEQGSYCFRYYRRHNFESRPAEEYEVHEMFYRSLRYREDVAAYLTKRGFVGAADNDFGHNVLTEYVHHPRDINGKIATAASLRRHSFVTFVACPGILLSQSVPVHGDVFWGWFQRGRYPTSSFGDLLPEYARTVAEGALRWEAADQDSSMWDSYHFVADTGYVEFGYGSPVVIYDRAVHFRQECIRAYFPQFLHFVGDLYALFSMPFPLTVMLNLKWHPRVSPFAASQRLKPETIRLSLR